MDDILLYRRQFFITNEVIKGLEKWQCQKIHDYYLYAHPDLELTKKEGLNSLIVLIGYIFDPINPEKNNEEILSDVIVKIQNMQDFIFTIKPYVGRYALIYLDKDQCAIFHDALGLREIYYCTNKNKVICGSQPNLISRYSDPKLGVTENRDILDFYQNDMKLVRSGRAWVGDETYFKDVKHLMPNHYLNIQSSTTIRYWPNKKLEKMDLDIAVKLSCKYLKGVLKAVTSRYKVMMAVTSGIDSRSLLAASKDVQDKIYYFINQEHTLNNKSADIYIPKSMFERLKIPFHIHRIKGPVDEEFKKVFLQNTFMSTDRILPTIYNVYYKKHQDKVNLLGVGELGREYYGEAPSELTGYYLAHKLKYRSSRYSTAQCERWLQEVKEISKNYNVDIMKLFLWEVLLGNWGAVGNSESDIAIEEFDPYDSHYIYEIMFFVEQGRGRSGIGELFEGMFMDMWPELMDYPFNPNDTYKKQIKYLFQKLGIYKYLKEGRYIYDRWKFNRMMGKN